MAFRPERWLNFSGGVAHTSPERWLSETVICIEVMQQLYVEFLLPKNRQENAIFGH